MTNCWGRWGGGEGEQDRRTCPCTQAPGDSVAACSSFHSQHRGPTWKRAGSRAPGHPPPLVSRSQWGSVWSPRLECSRTELSLLKLSLALRDWGIFPHAGVVHGWTAASRVVLPGLGPQCWMLCLGSVASTAGWGLSCRAEGQHVPVTRVSEPFMHSHRDLLHAQAQGPRLLTAWNLRGLPVLPKRWSRILFVFH